MKPISIIARKELLSFFSTSQAYIFLVAYLGFSNAFTFFLGGFFEINEASMNSFFNYQPWLYLFFMPAITMKMWAEEHRSGTTEFLLTLPLGEKNIVIGKFVAGWIISLIALALTFPLWISVNILGNPDNGVIFSSYIGSALLSGMLISIGLAISSATNSQVIAFIITIATSFLIIMSGTNFILDTVYDIAPFLADTIAALSAMSHFDNFTNGNVVVSSLFYFLISIAFWLTINYFTIHIKKA